MLLLTFVIYWFCDMNKCLFVSDLHGKMSRYESLFKIIRKEKPDFVFLGGDLLPHRNFQYQGVTGEADFIRDFLIPKFAGLKAKMECNYPDVYLIPGNDDRKALFGNISEGEKADLWRNIHNQCVVLGKYRLYGYACVPPTPFRMKDWERYDINNETGPGCIAPADGIHSTPAEYDIENDTIEAEIKKLVNDDDLEFAVFLFHSPPFSTVLDKAEISIGNYAAVGSKAIRNLIEEKQPYITLHGHIHESARITGEWKQPIQRTWLFSAAHDGPELALVRFELHNPASATRILVNT